jgi:SAM-dependent methyltransferase
MIDYNAIAERYAQHRSVHPIVLSRLAGALQRTSRVLEIGCGTGNYILALHQAVGCACWGVDPSAEMLSKITAHSFPVRVLLGHAELLDFPSQTFGFVFSVDVVHHVEDRPQALREAFRVLQPGGQICTVTDSEWVIRHREPLSVYFPDTVPIELKRYPSISTLEAEMAIAGFNSIHEDLAEFRYTLTESTPYRHRVFSSLLLLSEDAFQRGLQQMEADLRRGPIACVSRYTMLWGTRPKTTLDE